MPATIVNWAGDDVVSIEEWCAHLGEITGLQPMFAPTEHTLQSVVTDTTKLRSIVGSTHVEWRDGMRRMVEHLHPGMIRA